MESHRRRGDASMNVPSDCARVESITAFMRRTAGLRHPGSGANITHTGDARAARAVSGRPGTVDRASAAWGTGKRRLAGTAIALCGAIRQYGTSRAGLGEPLFRRSGRRGPPPWSGRVRGARGVPHAGRVPARGSAELAAVLTAELRGVVVADTLPDSGDVARVTARPGMGDRLVAIPLTGLNEGSPGASEHCVVYLVSRSASAPDVVHVTEGWTSEEDHHRIFAGAAAQAIVARIDRPLAAEPAYTDYVPVRGKAARPDRRRRCQRGRRTGRRGRPAGPRPRHPGDRRADTDLPHARPPQQQ